MESEDEIEVCVCVCARKMSAIPCSGWINIRRCMTFVRPNLYFMADFVQCASVAGTRCRRLVGRRPNNTHTQPHRHGFGSWLMPATRNTPKWLSNDDRSIAASLAVSLKEKTEISLDDGMCASRHPCTHAKIETIVSTNTKSIHMTSTRLAQLWISVFLFLLFSTYLAWPFATSIRSYRSAEDEQLLLDSDEDVWATHTRRTHGKRKINQSILDIEIFLFNLRHVRVWVNPPNFQHSICGAIVCLSCPGGPSGLHGLNEWIMCPEMVKMVVAPP